MAFADKPLKTISELGEEAKKAVKVVKKFFMLVGPPGTGKTWCLTTIPKDDKLLYLDFDNKGDMLLPQIESGQVVRIDLAFSTETYTETFSNLMQVMKDLRGDAKGTFQWIAADSLTNLYALLEKQILKSKTKTDWDDMGWIDSKFWEILYTIVGACNYTVLTAHEDIRGESDATIKVVPLARKALSQAIPGRVKELYQATTTDEGENTCYVWRTKPHGIYMANTLISHLPAEVPNNFDFILSTNWEKVEDISQAIKDYEKRTSLKITRWKV